MEKTKFRAPLCRKIATTCLRRFEPTTPLIFYHFSSGSAVCSCFVNSWAAGRQLAACKHRALLRPASCYDDDDDDDDDDYTNGAVLHSEIQQAA